VTWNHVTYHDAAITAAQADIVTISAKDPVDAPVTFEMPLSKVPDEMIQAYRAAHREPMADRPPTPEEAAAIKTELAQRKKRLANLRQALAADPNHPVMVVGHIAVKDADGAVIECDAGTQPGIPQSVGTVFLLDFPTLRKMHRGDPIGVIGYKAGKHIYNFQNVDAYSIRPPAPPSSTGSTPASSP